MKLSVMCGIVTQTMVFIFMFCTWGVEQVHPLTKETISQQLSLLCRTGNGLAHAFAKVDLQDK